MLKCTPSYKFLDFLIYRKYKKKMFDNCFTNLNNIFFIFLAVAEKRSKFMSMWSREIKSFMFPILNQQVFFFLSDRLNQQILQLRRGGDSDVLSNVGFGLKVKLWRKRPLDLFYGLTFDLRVSKKTHLVNR